MTWYYLDKTNTKIPASPRKLKQLLLNNHIQLDTTLIESESKLTTTPIELIDFHIEINPFNSYKKSAIFLLILTMNPLFFISIIMAKKAEKLYKIKQYEKAKEQANFTKKVNILLSILSLMLLVATIIKINKIINELISQFGSQLPI